MSTPKFFPKFSLKDSPKNTPDASPDATPAISTEEVLLETPAIPDPHVPQRSDTMKEAWNAANAEPAQAQGAEKLLNRVGASIASVPCMLR